MVNAGCFVSLYLLGLFGSGTTDKFDYEERYAAKNEFPYVVSHMGSFGARYVHLCSGVIVGQQRVLASAHCLTKGAILSEKVVAGTRQIKGEYEIGYQERRVVRKIVHPDYRKKTKDIIEYDIGLIEVDRAFLYKQSVALAPIDLGRRQYHRRNPYSVNGSKCHVTGWGSRGGLKFGRVDLKESGFLRTVAVDIITNYRCKRRLCNVGMCIQTSDDIICTASAKKNSEGVCPGGAGGPLICNNTVIGILSWSIPCYKSAAPNRYAPMYLANDLL